MTPLQIDIYLPTFRRSVIYPLNGLEVHAFYCQVLNIAVKICKYEGSSCSDLSLTVCQSTQTKNTMDLGLSTVSFRNVLATSRNKLKLHVTGTHYYCRHTFSVRLFVQKLSSTIFWSSDTYVCRCQLTARLLVTGHVEDFGRGDPVLRALQMLPATLQCGWVGLRTSRRLKVTQSGFMNSADLQIRLTKKQKKNAVFLSAVSCRT